MEQRMNQKRQWVGVTVHHEKADAAPVKHKHIGEAQPEARDLQHTALAVLLMHTRRLYGSLRRPTLCPFSIPIPAEPANGCTSYKARPMLMRLGAQLHGNDISRVIGMCTGLQGITICERACAQGATRDVSAGSSRTSVRVSFSSTWARA